MASETRNLRKRRWKSSPQKTARLGLDFGQGTPSPKKRRLVGSGHSGIPDHDSFTIGSFYGKREKTHFPHSPGRRKAVDKVLQKITDENTDSENDSRAVKPRRNSHPVRRAKGKSPRPSFDFHSSDSAENEDPVRNILKPTNIQQKKSAKKVPLKIDAKKTPINRKGHVKAESKSTGKLPSKPKLTVEDPTKTPISASGRKFFKTRSPASADRVFGAVVIKKGFEVKFLARKLNLSAKKDANKDKSDKKKVNIPKTKAVEKVQAKSMKCIDPEGMFTVAKNQNALLHRNNCDNAENTKLKEATEIQINNRSLAGNTNKADRTAKSNVEETNSAVGTGESTEALTYEKLDGTTDILYEEPITASHTEVKATNSEVEATNSEDEAISSEVEETNSEVGATNSEVEAANSEVKVTNSEVEESNCEVEATGPEDNATGAEVEATGSEDLFSLSSKTGRSTPVSVITPSVSLSPSSSTLSSEDVSLVSGPEDEEKPGKKLFPIFTKGKSNLSTPSSTASSRLSKLKSNKSPKSSPLWRNSCKRTRDTMDQMGIDAGQKRFGVTQCDVCSMVYEMANPTDEMMHNKFHQGLLSALKFPGWKKERVVQNFVDTGSRIIMVTAEDPKYATKKVEQINRIMGEELGFPEPTLSFRTSYQAFLFVSEEKTVEGCCVCEPITQAFPVLADSQDSQSTGSNPSQRPWYCSDTPVPATIGVSRIWVYGQARRKGVATKLLDCVRQWSVYGTIIPKTKLAFSDPTPDGKTLATKYTGTPHFLVYKFA